MLRKAKMVQRISPSRESIVVEVSRSFFRWSVEVKAGVGGMLPVAAVKVGCGLAIFLELTESSQPPPRLAAVGRFWISEWPHPTAITLYSGNIPGVQSALIILHKLVKKIMWLILIVFLLNS